jgi:hypothetical protein
MKNFKFFDDKSDIEGMSYFEHTHGFNGTIFKLKYYTDLEGEDRFNIMMHICATLGGEDMETEENMIKFKNIMEEFYHRVNVERTELSDDEE